MSALIKVPFLAHFDFRSRPSVRVMESFALGNTIFAGVQDGAWLYDEYYWSERKGAWGGHDMPARQTVATLSLAGATLETGDFAFGPEPLVRVPTGTSPKATGTILYGASGDVPSVYHLYSCATGALAAQSDASGTLGIVPDGSYLLWSRFIAGATIQTLYGPCQRYEGEWSAVRVVVGSGAWSVADGICPNPGPALYQKNRADPEVVWNSANSATHRVAFDPLARTVSSSCLLEQDILLKNGDVLLAAGSQLIGGLRASRGGPQTALWQLNADGTARLLGLQTDLSDGRCECGKTNHNAVDVVQSPTGELFVLSECALFRFIPDAPTLEAALVGFPANTLPEPGQPGGNCLRFPS